MTPEEGVARELFEEVFAEWIDDEARAGGPVTDALRRGLAPDALRELAATLHAERALVLSGRSPATRSRTSGWSSRSLVADGRARRRRGPAPISATDAKVLLLSSAIAEVRGLLSLDLDALAAARLDTEIGFQLGKRGLFSGALKEYAEAFRDEWKKLPARLASLHDEALLATVAAAVRDGFLHEARGGEAQARPPRLRRPPPRARDLLRDSRAAREHFQARFPHLVVDEFQDTDPVQAEIVLRIAAQDAEQDDERGRTSSPRRPRSSSSATRSSRSTASGGPTSRSTATSPRAFAPSARLSLVTNFRSAPRILDFVNGVFESVFEAAPSEPWEVAHAPLVPDPKQRSRGGRRAGALPLDAGRPGRAGRARRAGHEGSAPDLDGRGRRCRGREGDDPGGARRREPPPLALLRRAASAATAVLLGSNDAIDLFQEVFRDAGIPAVLDGGVSFYRREETAAVVAALRAVDDPSDGISTVAALKSFLFGLTDVELLDASEAGTRFDDPATAPAAGPVAEAFAALAALRARRHARPFAETLLDLLSSRFALAAVENGAVVNPLQASANLERLLVLARALDDEGLPFREAVARLALRLEEKVPEPRAFEEDEDAVRLMTLHKAKGLEFDTVVVAGLGFRDREQDRGEAERSSTTAPAGSVALRASMAGTSVGDARLPVHRRRRPAPAARRGEAAPLRRVHPPEEDARPLLVPEAQEAEERRGLRPDRQEPPRARSPSPKRSRRASRPRRGRRVLTSPFLPRAPPRPGRRRTSTSPPRWRPPRSASSGPAPRRHGRSAAPARRARPRSAVSPTPAPAFPRPPRTSRPSSAKRRSTSAP